MKYLNNILKSPLFPYIILGIVLLQFKDFFMGIFAKKIEGVDLFENIVVDYSKGMNLSQVNTSVQSLLNAFNSKEPFYGTDESLVKEVFTDLDSNDFKKIYKVFGLRSYNGYNSPPETLHFIDSYESRDLLHWLRSEINPISDYSLYKLISQVVVKAGFIF